MANPDPRLKQLSYSSLLTLHNCPRKYQLYKLNSTISNPEDVSTSITFAYGHTVGKGIQDVLENKSLDQCILEAFLDWECDLLDENVKQNKSFWGALQAIKQFHSMRENGYLDGYELMEYEGKPACELSFSITLPDGYTYRGFVDAVLQHVATGAVLVLEAKTTATTSVNPAQYKNSAQAIGYSIVLDVLAPALSSYEVQYLVYQTKSESFQSLSFEKSYYQRALWIRELLLDVEVLKMYEEVGIYPMHGESCYQFFRECSYLNICTLSTDRITTPLTSDELNQLEAAAQDFQIKLTIQDLIDSQLAKDVTPPTQQLTEDELL